MFYPVCMQPAAVSITLGTTGESWGMYYAEVMTEDLFVIGRSTYYAKDYAQTFYPFYTVRPAADWKLFYGDLADGSWKNAEFVDSAWQNLKPSAFPELSSVSQYYRKTFSVANVNNTATIYYKFRVSAGIIAYLNGKEIYRSNMPAGQIASSTKADTEFLTAQTITGTIVVEEGSLVDGVNVLAVETHSVAVPTSRKNLFQARC